MDNEEFDIFGTGPESKQKHEKLMKFLDRERQNNPQEVTQREIDLIKRLDENSCILFNPLEIMVPTIKRNPSQEQLSTLMELYPSCLSEAYHCLQNTPEDRNIARNIIDIAQKSNNTLGYYEDFTNNYRGEEYTNSLVRDPELTTLMIIKLKEININAWNTVAPLKNFLEKVAPTCAKHSKGKKVCMDFADTILKREESIFKEDQDLYRQNLAEMFPNVPASRQKDVTH